jgi:hypothetical protein
VSTNSTHAVYCYFTLGKLKWAFLIACCTLFLFIYVKCLYFWIRQNYWVNFYQTRHKLFYGKGDSSFFKWGAVLSTRDVNSKYIKSCNPEPAGQFQSNIVQIILGWRECSFKGKAIMRNAEILWGPLLKNHLFIKVQIPDKVLIEAC